MPDSVTHRCLGLLVVVLGGLLVASGCQSGGPGSGVGSHSGDEEIWAIRCITLQGTERFKQADRYAASLKQVPGLKPELVQVLSDEDGTTVFYGRYQRRYGRNQAEQTYKPNHLRDLETIRNLQLQGTDVWPFILATMDVLPIYRSSHPEWDLNNVDGYWSLHVAVFYNTETLRTRRSAAEQYCQILRDQGEEAYFHHGSTNSSVYIGVYPYEAVSEVQRENPLSNTIKTDIEITDPKMKAAQERFPISLHNGHKEYTIYRNPQTHEVEERLAAPSFPVILPRAQEQGRPDQRH